MCLSVPTQSGSRRQPQIRDCPRKRVLEETEKSLNLETRIAEISPPTSLDVFI